MSSTPSPELLSVSNLSKYFEVRRGATSRQATYVKAVDCVDFSVRLGETFGLVGESGCGKSTVGRLLVRLYDPTSGTIVYGGRRIDNLVGTELKKLRREMQMIFQDPYSSLNPRMTVSDIVSEPLEIHCIRDNLSRKKEVLSVLDKVGLSPRDADKYPHEFSGGQRQRIGIARALVLSPKVIVCDEPISALDVSIQAQIVNLLHDLQSELKLTYLFIAHDLSMVKYISDTIGVMYLGKLVEVAPSDELYRNPKHPYTQALLSSIPIADPKVARESKRIVLQGSVPSPMNPPSGCRFRTRCKMEMPICSSEEPEFCQVGPAHKVACHLTSSCRK